MLGGADGRSGPSSRQAAAGGPSSQQQADRPAAAAVAAAASDGKTSAAVTGGPAADRTTADGRPATGPPRAALRAHKHRYKSTQGTRQWAVMVNK